MIIDLIMDHHLTLSILHRPHIVVIPVMEEVMAALIHHIPRVDTILDHILLPTMGLHPVDTIVGNHL